jgi:hypothetical protein
MIETRTLVNEARWRRSRLHRDKLELAASRFRNVDCQKKKKQCGSCRVCSVHTTVYKPTFTSFKSLLSHLSYYHSTISPTPLHSLVYNKYSFVQKQRCFSATSFPYWWWLDRSRDWHRAPSLNHDTRCRWLSKMSRDDRLPCRPHRAHRLPVSQF